MFVQCISSPHPYQIPFRRISEHNISSYAAVRRGEINEWWDDDELHNPQSTQASTLCHSDDKMCRGKRDEEARHVWCFRPGVSQEQPQHSWPFLFSHRERVWAHSLPRPVSDCQCWRNCCDSWCCPHSACSAQLRPHSGCSPLPCVQVCAPHSLLCPLPARPGPAYLEPINCSRDVPKITSL